MLECRLTPQLSGARPRRPNRIYFVPTHRFPPTINEDEVACSLHRKLDMPGGSEEPPF
jgi:hypothetical protein